MIITPSLCHQMIITPSLCHQMIVARGVCHQIIVARSVCHQMIVARSVWHQINITLSVCHQMQYWPSTDNIRTAKGVFTGTNSYGIISGLQKNVLYKLRVYPYSRGGDGGSSPDRLFTLGKTVCSTHLVRT